MNKKQIVALATCVATVALSVAGATLAYFTDKDKVNNTFTIGNIDIDLYEYAGRDGNGDYDGMKFQERLDFTEIMPGDEMVKIPMIENTGANAAYVRVAVQINNHEKRNAAIDEAYAELGQEKVQEKYNYIFNGWGINNTKAADGIEGYTNGIRGSMAQRTSTTEGVTIIGIDSVRCPNATAGYQWEAWNMFQTEAEKNDASQNFEDKATADGYYAKALNADSNLYVFYLRLEPGKSYELFQGLNVPAEFTAEQLAMFEGMKIDIYADAIQVDNFVDEAGSDTDFTKSAAYSAFTALEAANPLGWWNTAE